MGLDRQLIEDQTNEVDGVHVPLIRMRKALV
jgi:hypothetical protein